MQDKARYDLHPVIQKKARNVSFIMIRPTCLIVSLAVIFAIVSGLPQQPKSRRPVPEFKVCSVKRKRYTMLLENERAYYNKFNLFFERALNFRTRPAAWNFRTMRRWFVTISWTTSPVKTEFMDITPIWITIAKFSTFACRRLGDRSDGASSAPRRPCLIRWVIIRLVSFSRFLTNRLFVSLGDVRLHKNGKFDTLRGVWEVLQFERGDWQGSGGRGKRHGARHERIGRGSDFEQTGDQDVENLEPEEAVAKTVISWDNVREEWAVCIVEETKFVNCH